jgi:ChrR Cupin-like domain
MASLVRMDGGIRYPPDRHTDTEELYLLEGDLAVEQQVLLAGDYCAAIAGTMHGSMYSQDGCTFILIASEPERLSEAQTLPDRRRVWCSSGLWKAFGEMAQPMGSP